MGKHYKNREMRVMRVWTYVYEYTRANGYAPSLREISAALDISTSTAARILNTLTERGVLKRERIRARGIDHHIQKPYQEKS